MSPLALAGAALVGIFLGATGGGGSILAVPLFVHVMDVEPKLAVAMSLPVVGVTSLVAALGHWRAGHVRIRTALVVGGIAMAAAFAGARLSAWLTGRAQMTLLAVVMLVAAVGMWRRSVASPESRDGNGVPPRLKWTLIPVALGAGLLTGLVGVGGGFLFVPALVVLAGMPITEAAGTSLVIIVLNAAAGFAGYLGRVTLPWMLMASVVAIAGTASLGGVLLTRVVPRTWLERGFAAALVVIAASMLFLDR